MKRSAVTGIAIGVGVIAFFGMFALFGFGILGIVIGAAVFAAILGLAQYAFGGRPEAHAEYEEESDDQVKAVERVIREIQQLAKKVNSQDARAALTSACTDIPDLLNLVRLKSPNSLYSSASLMSGHLQSLKGALSTYLSIQAKPRHFADAQARMEGGEAAFTGFANQVVKSIQLVNNASIAEYEANLSTVAPPELPTFS